MIHCCAAVVLIRTDVTHLLSMLSHRHIANVTCRIASGTSIEIVASFQAMPTLSSDCYMCSDAGKLAAVTIEV
jgi:hypothetical protein